MGITRVPNADGPAGWLYGAPSGTYSTWCGETVLASTWNKELAREKGIGMGNEALWGNGSAYSKIPFWYAPAVNIHRSPFSGRNFEYYSEDGVLAGLMAASCIDGAQSKGLMCYVKHFGVNDQESNRCGLLTWLDEQSMREIYIRPFELCVTEGGTMAMMSSLNKIGTQWAGGSYELLTEILRNEWGFNGNVVTDSYAHGTWSNGDMMIRAGGNLALGTGSVNFNKGTATTVAALRKAAQGVLYSHANSMAMNTGSRPTKPRALISYETAALKTAVVNLSYTASVATAKINDEIYPNVDESEIVYTLAEGSTLPEGLQLMPNGDIVGTPVEETTYHGFKVVATFADDTRESSFALSIINSSGAIVYAPQSALLPEASIKVEYSASVAEAKIEKPDATEEEIAKFPEVTYSLADASLLPEGLTLSSDGIISGTPTKECVNYTVGIVASAMGYKDVTFEYVISVTYPIDYQVTTLANGKYGENYIASVATAQSEQEVTYALKEGSTLPKGLTLTAGGYIVGKPIEITTDHEFTVVATANMAQTAECTYKITVGLAFDKNVVLIDGQVGVEYSADIKAAGARNVIHTIKEGTLPEGVVMNNDGSFSGTPTKAGVYTFTVQAEKDGCLGDEIEVTIYIANGAAGGCVGNVETSSVIVISALGLTALALVKRTLNKKRKGDL